MSSEVFLGRCLVVDYDEFDFQASRHVGDVTLRLVDADNPRLEPVSFFDANPSNRSRYGIQIEVKYGAGKGAVRLNNRIKDRVQCSVNVEGKKLEFSTNDFYAGMGMTFSDIVTLRKALLFFRIVKLIFD